MSYVENNLTKNETVIEKADIHWFIYSKGVIAIVLGLMVSGSPDSDGLSGFLIFLGLALLVNAFIIIKTTELAVTNKRVIAKYGLISRNTVEINLNKIEGLNVDQGIFGRILNYGNITIGGTGGKKSPIKFINKPLAFRKTVNEQTEEE